LKIQALKRAARYIGTVLMIISIVFIINRIVNLGVDFSHFFTLRYAQFFIAAVLIYSSGIYILANCWRVILTVIARKELNRQSVNSIFIKANIFKYLPGNIMQFVGRNLLGSELNIPQRAIALSSLFEIAAIGMVSFILALLTGWRALFELIGANTKLPLIITLTVIIIIAAATTVIILRERVRVYLNLAAGKAILKCAVGYTLFFFLLFLAFSAFLWLELPEFHGLLKIASAVIISWLAGFVVIGAPGGIGVREAVLLFVLGEEYGEGVILYTSILQRFSMMLGDVVIYLIVVLWQKRVKRPDF
jgi:hypothetical protein